MKKLTILVVSIFLLTSCGTEEKVEDTKINTTSTIEIKKEELNKTENKKTETKKEEEKISETKKEEIKKEAETKEDSKKIEDQIIKKLNDSAQDKNEKDVEDDLNGLLELIENYDEK